MKSKLAMWLLFTILCVLGASRWLVPDSSRSAEGVPAALAAGSLLAAAFALGLVSRQKTPSPDRQVLWKAASGGAMLFAGLALPQSLRTPGATSAEWTIALALTPVIIGVAEPAMGQTLPESLAGQLWPGLAGVAGLLLFLTEPSIASIREGLTLATAPLLTGIGAALLGSLEDSSASVRAFALTGACSIAMLGFLPTIAKAVQMPGSFLAPSLWSIGFEGASLLLSFTVLSRMGAFRWSAIFAVVPLLLSIEGAVLMRPPLGARPLLGMGLLLLASIFLLLPVTRTASR